MTFMLDQGNISKDVGVYYVPPMQLEAEWRNAASLVRLAQKRLEDKMDMSDVYRNIKSGSQQLWMIYKEERLKAAMVTSVDTHPKCNVFHIMLIGGFDMQEWLMPALDVIKDAAKKLGCKTI